MPDVENIKSCLAMHFSDGEVHVSGDDGRHFQVVVISDDFVGKNRVQQHQAVYKALGDQVGKDIHAVSISTYTCEKWQQQKRLTGEL